VAEVPARSVDAVGHQRLDVLHVVLLDDLPAEGIDDDDHDLVRRGSRLRRGSRPGLRSSDDADAGERQDSGYEKDEKATTSHVTHPFARQRRVPVAPSVPAR
jgi:hypothetical protein